MSYDTTRDSEQLDVIDHSIDDFIDRYNNSSGPASGPRQTIFLFPGGMGSTLKRATTAYDDTNPGVQTFKYKTVWATPFTFLGDALDLKMTKTAPGKYRDKGNRIIVADGQVSFLGCTFYDGFTGWCAKKSLDSFIFGWDWRRRHQDSGKFFVAKFLPYFQQRVKDGCNNADPLASFSIVGHSAGGMVVNWILRSAHPNIATMAKAITVATPFYGYSGQVHRWFEGDPLLNSLIMPKTAIIKVICSLPACYAWQFLDYDTFAANQTAFAADPDYPLTAYPSVDKASKGVADPYNPGTKGSLSRYPTPSKTGFDADELYDAGTLVEYLASPLSAALAQKFFNIRGDTQADDTISSTTWDWVPPTDPTPIANVAPKVPGDGTQPGWTARHLDLGAGAYPGHVITVKGSDVEHMFTMNSPKTLAALAGIL
jgi:hypothetical protein